MDETSLRLLRDVAENFFNQIDERVRLLNKSVSELNRRVDHLDRLISDASKTQDRALKFVSPSCYPIEKKHLIEFAATKWQSASLKVSQLPKELVFGSPGPIGELYECLQAPTVELHGTSLGGLKCCSSLLVFLTGECRLVRRSLNKTLGTLSSEQSDRGFAITSHRPRSQTAVDRSKSSIRDGFEEITSVSALTFHDEFIAEHDLLQDVDELPSDDFDQLTSDLPDILPSLSGVVLDVQHAISVLPDSKVNPSSSSSRKSFSLHGSESPFSTSLTRGSSHRSLSPLPNDTIVPLAVKSPSTSCSLLKTSVACPDEYSLTANSTQVSKSRFLAQFESMFRPIEELPPPPLPNC